MPSRGLYELDDILTGGLKTIGHCLVSRKQRTGSHCLRRLDGIRLLPVVDSRNSVIIFCCAQMSL